MKSRSFGLEPRLLGTLCGVVASLSYTAAAICLREVVDCDPAWVSCIKAIPTMLVAGTIVCARGGPSALRVSSGLLAALIATGLFAQLVGNVANQWSLKIVGLSLNTPLTFGTLIVAGAVLGWTCLGERVTGRAGIAMLLLLIAIPVLRVGADRATAASEQRPDGWLVSLGVAAACLSGVAYATQGAMIRKVVRGMLPLPLTLLVFSTTGVVSLGLLSLARIGPAGMLATRPADLGVMVAAGVFNAVAFFALSKSLQLVPMVQVNSLNASQIAMAALAGIAFFGEPVTAPLVVGVGLTMAGLVLSERRPRASVASNAVDRVAGG